MILKDVQRELATNMKHWQNIENLAIASTGRIIMKTDNPIIRLIMEIIQRDSQMHYLVQEWIADSLSVKPVSLSYDDLQEVWEMIDKHVRLEHQMMDSVKEALALVKGRKMVVHEYLLNYLHDDEAKHDGLLKQLDVIKKDMLS